MVHKNMVKKGISSIILFIIFSLLLTTNSITFEIVPLRPRPTDLKLTLLLSLFLFLLNFCSGCQHKPIQMGFHVHPARTKEIKIDSTLWTSHKPTASICVAEARGKRTAADCSIAAIRVGVGILLELSTLAGRSYLQPTIGKRSESFGVGQKTFMGEGRGGWCIFNVIFLCLLLLHLTNLLFYLPKNAIFMLQLFLHGRKEIVVVLWMMDLPLGRVECSKGFALAVRGGFCGRVG